MEKLVEKNCTASYTQLSYEISKIVDANVNKKNEHVRQENDVFNHLTEQETVEHFYNNPSDPLLNSQKPWKQDPHYFRVSYVSSLALTKMSAHARSGGSIEIMGMLTGKIFANCIVVMDCYPLPVEGTETRVNAQSEGYEFMVQYLDALKETGRTEDIVGWYHSHPGYGCWLSGIDVATQALNQQFQDPYLAIVVDPERTIANERIEIGAFRTLPNEKNKKDNNNKQFGKTKLKASDVPDAKLSDFGVHHDRYYSLDVKFFESVSDKLLMNTIYNSQTSALINKVDKESIEKETESILNLSKELNDYKIPTLVVNTFSSAESQRPLRKHIGHNHHLNHRRHQQFQKGHHQVSLDESQWYLPEISQAPDVYRRATSHRNSPRHALTRGRSNYSDEVKATSLSRKLQESKAEEDQGEDSDEEVIDADDVDDDDDDDRDDNHDNHDQPDNSDIDISNNSNGDDEDNEEDASQLQIDHHPHRTEDSMMSDKIAGVTASSRTHLSVRDELKKHSPTQRKMISNEISKFFKQPPTRELDSEAGKIAVANLIELLTLNVQKELFSD